MAKGKAADGDQRSEVGGQPDAELAVWAVERLFVAAENRYVQPGELVILPAATALLLVEIGAAAEAPKVVDEDDGAGSF